MPATCVDVGQEPTCPTLIDTSNPFVWIWFTFQLLVLRLIGSGDFNALIDKDSIRNPRDGFYKGVAWRY